MNHYASAAQGQTNAWDGQSLRYIKSTIDTSEVPNGFEHFVGTFPERINPSKILDVGCGGGGWLRSMVSTFNGSTGVGLEPSAEGIRLLQKKHANCGSISFVQGSAHQLPFPSNSFDLVVAWSVLHWIGRDEYLQALGELIRVTSSILIINDFDPLDSYRTPYVHNPDFQTYKHDFEPLVLGTGIMKTIASSRWRMGKHGQVPISVEDRIPFAPNPVNWDCRKMVIFSKDYGCMPVFSAADFFAV